MDNYFTKSPTSLKGKLLRGGLYATSAKIIIMLAGLGTQVVLARLLGPELLGVFFLFLSIVGVSVMLVKAGIDRTILRLVAEAHGRGDWGEIRGLVKTSLILVAVTGAAVTVLLKVFSFPIGTNWFQSPLLSQVIGAGCILVFLQGLQGIIGESFRGLHAIGRASYFQGPVSSSLFMFSLLILWIYNVEAGLNLVVFLSMVSFAISISIAGGLLMRLIMSHGAEAKKTDVKNMLSIASPMFITSAAVFILGQMDIFVLGMFMAKSEVGFYGAASRLAVMVGFIILIINANVQPIMADLYHKKDFHKLERILRTTATMGLGVCIPVSLALIVWGDRIIKLFYGAEFVEGAQVLAILTVGKFMHVSLGSSGALLQMTGFHKPMMNISIIVALLSVASFFLVVRPYGKEGVAIVSAVALTVQNLLQVYYARKLTGLWTLPSLVPKRMLRR